MSMDKSAIEKIQEGNALSIARDQLEKQKLPGLVIAPNNMEAIDLERYMPNARHFKLRFETKVIGEFVRYASEHATKESGIFIDDEHLSSSCCIDLGTVDKPLHQFHGANLRLKKTAAYSAILSMIDRKLNQKEAAEFIEDWKHEVAEILTSDEGTMTVGQAASSMRNLSIEQAREVNSKVDDFGYSASAQERLEAKNKDRLPSFIKFKVAPYHGLDLREITLRMGVIPSGEAPYITFRIVGNEALKEELAVEFKGILEKKLADCDAPIYIGTI
jgi:uncharacterized protein YfdQ (DUF2303 family)